MTEDSKALAAAAKARGNGLFAKKTREGYEQALAAYEEAISLDPTDHVFHANCAACNLELAADEYEPVKKVEAYARALSAAQRCTLLGPLWAKGYVRQATAEFELIAAKAKWEERKQQDEKWRREDEERAEKARKEGKEPFKSHREKEDKAVDPASQSLVDSACYSSCEASCRRGLELEATNEQLRTLLQSLRDAGHRTNEEQDKEMRNPGAAASLKAEGNAAISAKNWKLAAEQYTKALAQDPFDHVFYSNRSAAYAESEEYEKALQDADRCIELNPQFAKGYSRRALALFHVGRYVDMESAAKAGLAADPESTVLQDLLKQAQVETKETPEAQQMMHQLRKEKRQDEKLQDLLRGLGGNVQMFQPGAGGAGGAGDLSSFMAGLTGGGSGGGFGGGFGGAGVGKARMTEEQMRAMSRVFKSETKAADKAASGTAPTAEPAGPTSFAPTL